jgi:hypothetical protein
MKWLAQNSTLRPERYFSIEECFGVNNRNHNARKMPGESLTSWERGQGDRAFVLGFCAGALEAWQDIERKHPGRGDAQGANWSYLSFAPDVRIGN